MSKWENARRLLAVASRQEIEFRERRKKSSESSAVLAWNLDGSASESDSGHPEFGEILAFLRRFPPIWQLRLDSGLERASRPSGAL